MAFQYQLQFADGWHGPAREWGAAFMCCRHRQLSYPHHLSSNTNTCQQPVRQIQIGCFNKAVQLIQILNKKIKWTIFVRIYKTYSLPVRNMPVYFKDCDVTISSQCSPALFWTPDGVVSLILQANFILVDIMIFRFCLILILKRHSVLGTLFT